METYHIIPRGYHSYCVTRTFTWRGFRQICIDRCFEKLASLGNLIKHFICVYVCLSHVFWCQRGIGGFVKFSRYGVRSESEPPDVYSWKSRKSNKPSLHPHDSLCQWQKFSSFPENAGRLFLSKRTTDNHLNTMLRLVESWDNIFKYL